MSPTRRARIVGLGQPLASDDGVGFAVVERLRAEGLPEGVVADLVAEPSELVGALGDVELVVVVDAVVGAGSPGTVIVVEPDALDAGVRAVSTHGMSLRQALSMTRILCAERATPVVRVVGVAIDPASTVRGGALSAAVSAAIPSAAQAVRRLVARDR